MQGEERKTVLDVDHFEYGLEDGYKYYTRIDKESGTRFFLENYSGRNQRQDGEVTVAPRWRLLSRERLEDLFMDKLVAGVDSPPGLTIKYASFQALKKRNEDRVFTHTFARGTVIGVLDGHCGSACADVASKELPPLLEASLTAALDTTCGLPIEDVSQAIEEAFEKTFLDFDASLMCPVKEVVKELLEAYPDEDWTDNELYHFWMTEHMQSDRGAAANSGSCALIAFIPRETNHAWIACLGDSQALHGRYDTDSSSWTATPLNDFHNGSNEKEVERVVAEHPGEKDLFEGGALLGLLMCTRALGDHIMKVPFSYGWKYMRWMRTPWALVGLRDIDCVTVYPTSDILLLASDGLRDAYQLRLFSDEEKEKFIISIAGSASGGPAVDLSEWEGKLGHQFTSTIHSGHPGELMIRNTLFGNDDVKMAAELTMEYPKPLRYQQDDISTVLVTVM